MNRQKGMAIGILITSLVVAGGFYTWFSCIASVLLMAGILISVFREKRLLIIRNPFGIAVTVVAVCYLLVCLWAIDRGMALFGFFKFLPFPLYLIWLEQREINREEILQYLPAIGTVLTVLTYVMSFFETFDLVQVEGRLGGSFLYPNTFAIFLLVCLLIALKRIGEKDYFEILYAVILLFGIYQTGSRTVYIITALALLATVLVSGLKRLYKLLICIGGAGAVGVAAVLLGGRIAEISWESSTFLGRLLYYKDGLGIILKHPFGLGYHGYYFVEKQYQTGVYNVLNIHNDVLQLILDIGILPALFFFGVFVYYIVRAVKQRQKRNAVILSALLMHIFFDYDMQFLSILFLLVLLIDDRRGISREKVGGLSLGFVTVVSVLAAGGAVLLGLSDYLYTVKKYEQSYQIYGGNTMSEAYLLTELSDMTELRKKAEDVVGKNQEFYIGYSYLAVSYLQEGNVPEYIKYSRTTLEKAPYVYQSYVDYATGLIYAGQSFLSNGDTENAKLCVGELDRITEQLHGLKESSDSLAWKINDTPETELPEEYLRLIQSLKDQLNE